MFTGQSVTVQVNGGNYGTSMAPFGGIDFEIWEVTTQNGNQINLTGINSPGANSGQNTWWAGSSLPTGQTAQYLHIESVWNNWPGGGIYRSLNVTFTALQPGTYHIYSKMYLSDSLGNLPRDPSGTTPNTDDQGQGTYLIGTITVAQPYTVSLTAYPSGAGTVSGGGTYAQGSSVTTTASANGGYGFLEWLENGNIVSTSPNYQFTISANRNLEAVFEPLATITFVTNPSGLAVTVDGGSHVTPYQVTWTGGSSHTIATTNQSGSAGTQYVWSSWSDNLAMSHSVTSPTSNTTYTANFNTQYYLTMNTGSGGGVSPSSGYYNSGQSVQISGNASSGYTFSNWAGNGSGSYSGSGNPATVTMNGPITETASFTSIPVNYTITASAGTGGTISPSGSVSVISGGSQTFTITPNSGYQVSSVTVDGVNQGAITSYTFSNVTGNHTISVMFSQITYTITATAGTGGTISPSGSVTVAYGGNQSFAITPNSGYQVSSVTVDGVNQGAITSYTFSNVSGNHTISATFSQITYTITATAGTGGTISPSGNVSVTSGGSQTFTITANSGYQVSQVTVDGVSQGAITSYTFNNVTSNYTISASFEPTVSPALISSVRNLTFGNIQANSESLPQSYILTGNYLAGPVIIKAPNGFLVSGSESGGYSDSTTQSKTGVSILDTIWVKFVPTSAMFYSDTISNSSSGAAPLYVSVSGTGVTPAFTIIDLRDSIFTATVYSSDSVNNWTTSIKPFVKTSTGWQTPNGSGTTDWGAFVQKGSATSGGVVDSDAIYAPTDSTDLATVADYTLSYPDSISLKYGLGDGRQTTYADVRFVVQVKVNNEYTTLLDSTVNDSAGWRSFGASLSMWKDSVVTLRLITDPNGVTYEDWSYWADVKVEMSGVTTPPNSPTLAYPANDTTGPDTSLTLTWRTSATAASYELQLSTDSTFAKTFIDRSGLTSTSLTVSGLASGTSYYWRVDAVNSAGTSSWSEVWRFTTVARLKMLLAPTLVSPTNGATGLSTQLRFMWIPSADASTYQLEISADSSFSAPVTVPNLILPTDSVDTVLLPGTIYYWRVSASDSTGTSPWSAVWHFNTAGVPAQVPPTPILASPANGEIGLPASIRFRWNTSAGARMYELQVSADTSFSALASDVAGLAVTTDSVDTGLSPGTRYYWRVDASDSAGTSPWSDVWNFTTAFPVGPILAAPASGSAGVSTNPVVSWYRENGSSVYEVEVSADSTFKSNIYDKISKYDSTKAGPDSQAVNGLAMFTKYFWRVRASYAQVMSEWSQVWSFTTTTGLSVPALLSPFDSSKNVATNPQLSWNGTLYDSTYELQLSTDPTFGTLDYDGQNITGTAQGVSGLSQGTTYFWHVDAKNAYGSSEWSPAWSFTTFTYPSSIPLAEHYTSPSSISQTDYEIIGLPGAISIPVSSVMAGTQGKDWNAYWDNGADQSYYVEYDGSSTFNFTPGKAFWLLSKNSFDVTSNYPTVPIDTGDCYAIPLHSGWNLISDPFEKVVDWSDVGAINGATNPLWAFINGSWSQSSTLEPYHGYYYYNSTGLASLRVPYISSLAPAALKGAANNATKKNTAVTAILLDDSVQISSVSAGLRTVPELADIYYPPGGFERAGMCVIDSSVGADWKDLACEYVDSVGSGCQFDLYVSNKTSKNLDVHFDIGDGLAGYEVYLVDKDLSRSYNLNDTSRIVIPSYNKVKDFAILIGDKSFVNRKLAELVPHEFMLYQNYPNPFNPVTVIRFEIPSTEHVSLTVYDVLGRRVETLMDGEVSPGYYEVPFDGNRYASGVYFYRIVAGRSWQVKKMMLLK